ncbi:MAG: tetratricopeptide repeat protein, partial [Mobilitalea sp.]
LQFATATKLWECSANLDDSFTIVLRNLALSYYNKDHETEKARRILEKAFALNTKDARIFMELDQLYKKFGMPFQERIGNFEMYQETFRIRDDSFIEYITLKNLLERQEEAYELIMSHKFHPWEGGEGKITKQYTVALVEMAKKKIIQKEYEQAKEYLLKALIYPENLGEGKLEGTKDNDILYYLGCVMEALGETEKAREYFLKASKGTEELAGAMYYNDQPADMILFQGYAKQKLGDSEGANARFHQLVDYGEKHLHDNPRIEYFAVSLPDFLIFEEDLKTRNQVHCNYLIGLGKLGLGKLAEAEQAFEKALTFDNNNMNCLRYRKETRNYTK